MALVKAMFAPLDMNNLNFGFFNSNIVESGTTLGENVTITGDTYVSDWPDFTYPDVFTIRSTTGSADLGIELLGSFTKGPSVFPSAGTVGFIGLYNFDGGPSGSELVANYVILDLSVPVFDVLSAIQTNDGADDRQLFRQLFSGRDEFYLSEFDDTVYAHDGNDDIFGFDGDDELHGGAGADLIFGDAGDDLIFGGSGIDTAGFAGNRAAYTITKTGAGAFTISGPDGTDRLQGIEFALFDDETVQLNLLEALGAPGSALLYLSPGNQTYGPVPGGDLTNLFGSNLAERVTLAADANVILDPSFVRGNDLIIVDGASSDYKISANVAGITISSTNGAQLRIPSFGAGGGVQIQFSDGAADIETVDGGNSFRLAGFSGVQDITGTSVAIDSSVLTFA